MPPAKASGASYAARFIPEENVFSSGMSVIWIGTICSANTRMNSTFLPRNSVHAKA